MKTVLTTVVPFLVPFVVFFVWVWLRARWIEGHGGQMPPIEKGHLFWLTLAGGVLMIAALLITALLDARGGAPPGTPYEAPRLIDGKVVPGAFAPRDGASPPPDRR